MPEDRNCEILLSNIAVVVRDAKYLYTALKSVVPQAMPGFVMIAEHTQDHRKGPKSAMTQRQRIDKKFAKASGSKTCARGISSHRKSRVCCINHSMCSGAGR